MKVHASYQDRIKALTERLYAVDGKLLYVGGPDVLDLSTEDGAADSIAIAEDIYTPGSTVRRDYGEDSVCVLDIYAESAHSVTIAVCPVDVLDEESRGAARKERFDDVGKSAHCRR